MITRMDSTYHSKRTKVLVLTGSIGHGHKQAANAIQETMKQRYGDQAEIIIVDYLEQSAPYLHNVGSYCFIQLLKYFPSTYGVLFEWTRKDRKLAHLIKSVRLTSVRPLVRLIRELQPTVIVSTFPAAAAAVSKLRERSIITCPTATVITDHTDHSFWIYPFTDLYMVGSEHAKNKLIQQGVDHKHISVSGIPVHPAFYAAYEKQELRKQHGLRSDKMTVLLMGGGCGLLDPAILHTLEASPTANKIQIIVVCGNNVRLQQQLSQWSQQVAMDVHVHGYVTNMHEYMAMADVMITKSGGVTTAEAIAQHLPLIIYKPLPGQERDNIEYLLQTGLACCARDLKELRTCITDFVDNPSKLEQMRHSARIERSTAELDSAELLMELTETSQGIMHTGASWFRRRTV